MSLRRKAKKWIAVVLAGSLAAGFYTHSGKIETQAQEKTLPGIEQLVASHMNGTVPFYILEVVPEKSGASVGYLVGGEEPVAEGRKLSGMPSAGERLQAMAALKAAIDSDPAGWPGSLASENGPFTYTSAYQEDENGTYTQAVRGFFTEDAGGQGRYNYINTEATYKKWEEGSTEERFDRYFYFTEGLATGTSESAVLPDFSLVGEVSGIYLDSTFVDKEGVADEDQSYTSSRYVLSASQTLNDARGIIVVGNATLDSYVGKDVYIKNEKKEYSYYGRVVKGLPEGIRDLSDSGDVSGGDVSGGDVSGGDSVSEGKQQNYYIVDYYAKTAVLWAEKEDDSYDIKSNLPGEFAEFTLTPQNNGDYYISRVRECAEGPYNLRVAFEANTVGYWMVDDPGRLDIYCRDVDKEKFDPKLPTYNFLESCTGSLIGEFRYQGGISSAEWFKRHVLNLSEDELAALDVEVVTLTVSELADLVQNGTDYGFPLDDVDLIYLSGRGTVGAEPEGAADAALRIAQMAYGAVNGTVRKTSRVPVVVDYNFYVGNQSKGNTVLSKLALLLLDAASETRAQEVAAVASDGGRSYFDQLEESALRELVNQGLNELNAGGDFSAVREYLAGNVYLNNDTFAGYVASDFLTDFEDVSMAGSHRAAVFADVLQEIEYENFLLENSGAAERIDAKVTKASITRYILNWSRKRSTVKDELRVLDLEPCYDYTFDDRGYDTDEDGFGVSTVKNLMGLGDSYTGKIDVVNMASSEFIGKIEDLNESYDLIYLGARTGAMNTVSGKTVYNDRDMNGLIYTHTGDLYSYKNENTEQKWRLRDIFLSEDMYAWKLNDPISDDVKYYDVYRGPGNDINSTRCDEFKQYVEAGYPVVIADALLSDVNGAVKINRDAVDCNSYYYQFLEFVLSKDDSGYLYWEKSVFAQSRLTTPVGETQEDEERKARQEEFCRHLNLSKLTIYWESGLGERWMPEEYAEGKNSYLSNNEMQFIFSLENNAAASQTTTSYDCKLYIDGNADGRFAGSEGQDSSASEELGSLDLYVRSGSEWAGVERVERDGELRYELYTGQIYKVVRNVPGEYKGVLPWKLIFYDNADRLVRTSVTGYTALPRNGSEKVRVLQLMSDKSLSSPKEVWNLSSDGDVSRLLEEAENITGLRVDLTSKKTSSFASDVVSAVKAANYNNVTYALVYDRAKAEFDKYDMLILGFGDNYTFGDDDDREYSDSKINVNMAIAEAVRDCIEEGKSVLFTHDSSSYVNTDAKPVKKTKKGQTYYEAYSWAWGYEFNKTLRAAVGLDRFGALEDYYRIMGEYWDGNQDKYQAYAKVLEEKYQFDTLTKPKSDGELLPQKEGLTKYTVVGYAYKRLEALREGDTNGFYFPVKNALLATAIHTNKKNGDDVDTDSDRSGGKVGRQYLQGQYVDLRDSSSVAGPNMIVTPVNEGQITTYPFQITDKETQALTVECTHYQWLQPNMELDKDGDGKNDIVVWYCLSDLSPQANANKEKVTGSSNNIYNICPNDVVNNYYIYSMGNVTYSGAGHTKPKGEAEKRLFVNTMIAAYSVGVKAPSAQFQNNSGETIEAYSFLYDGVNRIVINGAGSVDVNFAVTDYNIMGGNPVAYVEFYKKVASGGTTVPGISADQVVKIPASSITVQLSGGSNVNVVSDEEAFDGYFRGGFYPVSSGSTYKVSIKADELGFLRKEGEEIKLQDAASDIIYIRATTVYNNGSQRTDSGSGVLTVNAADLFDLR